MKLIIELIAILLGIAFVLPSPAKPINSEQQVEQNTTENQDIIHSITHGEIVHITDEFMAILVQDIDMNYKVKNYNNKASLIEAFEKIATEEVVKTYIDYYYIEENDGLYIVPTETPPWFDKQNEYVVVQLEKNKVLMKQVNKSELYGDYGIEIEFTFANQEWKITKITHR